MRAVCLDTSGRQLRVAEPNATAPEGDRTPKGGPDRSPPARRATIVDVAQRAGVSVASASKVLRDSYGVSDQMKIRVRQAMAELEYRPSASARGMRGRTYTVGITVPDIDNQFVARLIKGASDGLHESGFELIIGAAGNDPLAQSKMVDAMLDRQMDGLILFAPYASRERLGAVARTVPTVMVSRHASSPDYDTVVGDDLAGARLVIDHLVDLGHHRISYVTHDDGPTSMSDSPQSVRERGYRAAMLAHELGDRIDVISSSWTHVGGQAAAAEVLSRKEMPTALFAGADVAAFGVLSGLWEGGLSIPGDISVAGYDNTSLAELLPISLTTVDQCAWEMGRSAAQSLLERVEGRTEPKNVVLAPQLQVRGSTALPRTA